MKGDIFVIHSITFLKLGKEEHTRIVLSDERGNELLHRLPLRFQRLQRRLLLKEI